ncbi:hypothetical protein CALCODRAFT_500822 [Calocera cornea HHB12733]|uniref:Cytochrome b5 heme-binding domain-containing protein n=1 Tax=Calocera cornea HHB12733 TaxID=1353952 RepID=A0A165DWF8_9BASI|nr:hypothetical protein CALCODRAFT_500822 [Calocera cornea HHB12733]
MASYISSWWSGSPAKPQQADADAGLSPSRSNSASKPAVNGNGLPQIVIGNGDASDADATPHASPQITANGVEIAQADASELMFPAPNSAQRVAAPAITLSSPVESPKLDGSDRNMPPPPIPASNGVGGLKAAVKAQKKAIKRQLKEALAPGHSQMDWAILKTKGHNLRGVDQVQRVTPSMLAQHNTKEDAWSVFFGKVYNITPYMSYHPGGERKLIKVAGKDGTRLFVHSHEWINVEAMMDECFVGFLVPEPPADD